MIAQARSSQSPPAGVASGALGHDAGGTARPEVQELQGCDYTAARFRNGKILMVHLQVRWSFCVCNYY